MKETGDLRKVITAGKTLNTESSSDADDLLKMIMQKDWQNYGYIFISFLYFFFFIQNILFKAQSTSATVT